MNANSGGGGNDWFNSGYDAKSKSVTDTIANGWTNHSESESTSHEEGSVVSNGSSSFTVGVSKPTGGEASGSVSLTYSSGSGDAWHVDNNGSGRSESRRDGGSSSEVSKSEWTSKYKVDDVYGSSYGGDPSATLNSDGSTTESGSSHADENYTFDQVSESKSKWSDESLSTYGGSSMPGGTLMPTFTQWDKWEHEYNFKTTDHYTANMSSGGGSDATSSTLTGSDEGYTDTKIFAKSCHSWNNNGTPDCNESTTTMHEDWPSYVDAALAMMQMEAEIQAAAEEVGDSTTTAANYIGNEETDATGGGALPESNEPESDEEEFFNMAGADRELRAALQRILGLATGTPNGFLLATSAFYGRPIDSNTDGRDGWCRAWMECVETKISTYVHNPKLKVIPVNLIYDGKILIYGNHWALRIEVTNDDGSISVAYIDNFLIGGSDHVFFPKDIDPSVYHSEFPGGPTATVPLPRPKVYLDPYEGFGPGWM